MTCYVSTGTLNPTHSQTHSLPDALCVQLTDRSDVIAVGILGVFTDSCVSSILQSDHRTVEETLTTFNISAEYFSIYSAETTLLVEQVLEPGASLDLCVSTAWWGFTVIIIIIIIIFAFVSRRNVVTSEAAPVTVCPVWAPGL